MPLRLSSSRRFAISTITIGLVSLTHALLTWSPRPTIAFFVGGALVAFIAEAVVINVGWLEHRIDPKLRGVPLYVLFGWTGAVYVAFRVALLVTDGWAAVALTGVLATTYDLIVDHRGVADGHWTYTDDLPGPRYRGVPWWNYLGWFAISVLTASLAVLFR